MEKSRIWALIIASIIALNAAILGSADENIGNKESNDKIINANIPSNNDDFANQSVVARVYVQSPNFDVVDKKDENIITLVKDAEIPKQHKGTLIRLKSEGLSQIKKVIVNLGIDEIIIYHKDAEIAKELIDSGFNVIIK